MASQTMQPGIGRGRPYLACAVALLLCAAVVAATARLAHSTVRPPLRASRHVEEVELKKAEEEPSFIATQFGARGCPTGSITVPSPDMCRQYALQVQNKGPCEKSEGYGADCDGPEDGRAPWCSSRPLGCWQSRNGCSYFKASGTDEPQGDVRPVCQVVARKLPSAGSLYCLSTLASEEERQLLKLQHEKGLGVFACEGHTVYSERETELTPGGSLTTALPGNLSYVEIWRHVLSGGRFRDFAWTLKASADAVFLPSRARVVLQGLWDPPRGIYVANCGRGEGKALSLNDALGTYSRNALEMYGRGNHFCLEGPTRLGTDHRGEGMFMDACMQKLGVYRRLDGSFLRGPGCHEAAAASEAVDCSEGHYVAFHPFTKQTAYAACAAAADA